LNQLMKKKTIDCNQNFWPHVHLESEEGTVSTVITYTHNVYHDHDH
jgi:hypothetical protein